MEELTLGKILSFFWNSGLPLVMFGVWFYTGFSGKWIWRRELDASAENWKRELDTTSGNCLEWKNIALRAMGITEETAVVGKQVAVLASKVLEGK